MRKKQINTQREMTLEGVMTLSQLETGQHVADFCCAEDIRTEPFRGRCQVQLMRDGNMYITETPRRQRNHPLFRDDNSTLTHSRSGKYYFVFILDDSREEELPAQLIQQARTIARKFFDNIVWKQDA